MVLVLKTSAVLLVSSLPFTQGVCLGVTFLSILQSLFVTICLSILVLVQFNNIIEKQALFSINSSIAVEYIFRRLFCRCCFCRIEISGSQLLFKQLHTPKVFSWWAVQVILLLASLSAAEIQKVWLVIKLFLDCIILLF